MTDAKNKIIKTLKNMLKIAKAEPVAWIYKEYNKKNIKTEIFGTH